MSNRLDKSAYFYGMMGSQLSVFPVISAALHRVRRNAIAPFFSVQALSRFSPSVHEKVDRLCDRMRQNAGPVPLFFAFRSMTADIISEYVYGKSLGLMEREDWGKSFCDAWRENFVTVPVVKQVPWFFKIMAALPDWVMLMINPKMIHVFVPERQAQEWTKQILDSDPEDIKSKDLPTIVWELSHSDALPVQEKTMERVAAEARIILGAGFETTGNILTHLTYNILADKRVHDRLVKELKEAIPNPDIIPDYTTLEKLPYLTAVIKETLRLNVGVYSRLPRVNPTAPMHYKTHTIPPNTATGMSAYYIHHDPTLFPSPTEFIPERWLDSETSHKIDTSRNLDRYLVSFGRGARSCVGINLAYMELFGTCAGLFRRFPGMRLFETGREDVETVHDYFSAVGRAGRVGLRVLVGE